jgi:hypothetical protein
MDGMDLIDSFVSDEYAHYRIARQLNESKKISLRSSRSSRFKIQKTNQRHLFIEPDLIELVTAFFTGYSDLTRQL